MMLLESVSRQSSNAIPHTSAQQRGAVTLFMAMIVLALITIVAVYTTRAITLETKIQGNDFRAKQAFEAAEAGYQDAIRWLSEEYDADSVVTDYYGSVSASFKSASLTNNSRYEVELTPNGDRFAVLSRGYSDDNRAYHVVRSEARPGYALPNMPGLPLTSRGTVDIQGSATVYNHEGHSTIWSGQNIDLTSNNATSTYVADPEDSDYPSCMDNALDCDAVESSNKATGVGLDGIENDADLWNLTADDLFRNYFGVSKAEFEAQKATMIIDSGDYTDASIDNVTDNIIYVNGNVSIGNVTVGCSLDDLNGLNAAPSTKHPSKSCSDSPAKPSILVIDGNLTLTGNPIFQGLVFVTGNLSAGGNASFQGALVVAGDTTNTSGSLDIWYDSDMLKNLQTIGGFAGTSGTWRDWPE